MNTLFADLLRLPLVQALGWALVHFLWQGTLLVVVVRALLLLLARASARTRYNVACAGFVAMAALPLATGVAMYPRAEAAAAPVAPAAGESAGPVVRVIQVRPGGVAEEVPAAAAPASAPRSSWVARIEAAVRPWLGWVVAVWLAGVALLSVRLIGGWMHLQRLRRVGTEAPGAEWEAVLAGLLPRIGVRRPVRLLASRRVEVPSVIGAFKPVVLLPLSVLSGLPPRDVELIIAHELAHVRRHDYLVNLLQAVVETVLFYHPGVWYLSGVIREERENCCDDLVVEKTSEGRRYARVLVAAEELRWATPPLAAPAMGGGALYRRIRRLVAGPAEGPGGGGVAGMATLLLVATVVLAAFTPVRAEARAAAGSAQPAAETPAGSAGRVAPPAVRPETAPATVDASAQDGLAGRWRAGRAAAAQRGWGSYWIGYAVHPRPGTRVSESNSPNPRPAAAAGAGEQVRLGAAPAATDAAFFFRMDARGEAPAEMKIRAGTAPAEIEGLPVVWLGPADDAESLALLERLRAQAPEQVRREIGPAASLHADQGRAVAFVRALLASESSPAVRAEAAYWLQHQPGAESLALLEEVVRRDASPKVREEAVTGIAQMKTPAAMRVLQRISDDTTLPLAVRREAMDWRSRVGGGS